MQVGIRDNNKNTCLDLSNFWTIVYLIELLLHVAVI